MARIKYSALVSDMRGKLNGSVATKNRFGSALRNKVTPVNRNSPAQSLVRARFSMLTKMFQTLTPEQIEAWNSATDSFRTTNIFGDSIRPTGLNLFVKLNSNLLSIGETVNAQVPSMINLPLLTLIGFDIDLFSEEAWWAWGSNNDDQDYAVVVSATPPMSNGVSFSKGKYKVINEHVIIAPITFKSQNLFVDYVRVFGTPPVGAKIFVSFKLVSRISGQSYAGNDLASKVRAN